MSAHIFPVRRNLWALFILALFILTFTQFLSVVSASPPTYEVTVKVEGLPLNLSTNVTVDGIPAGKIGGGESKVFKVESGTPHTIAAEEYVNESADTRYHCAANTWSFSAGSSHTFDYATQFLLTMGTSPPGIITFKEEGWYDEGTDLRTAEAPAIILGHGGTRYVFVYWLIDRIIISNEGCEEELEFINPAPVSMYSARTATAIYETQFYLTVNSTYGNPRGSGWCYIGSSASFSVTSPSPASGILGALGVKYIFDHWTGDSNASTPEATILMDSSKKVTANWRVDYTPIYTLTGIAAATVIATGAIGLRYSLRNMKAPPTPPLPQTPQKASCKYCGAERPAEAPYCPKCGKKQYPSNILI